MTTMNLIHLIEGAFASHAAAVAARVTFDVQRWGEGEREGCERAARARSHGLIVNSLIHDPLTDYGDALPASLRAKAKALLTAQDRCVLRSGG